MKSAYIQYCKQLLIFSGILGMIWLILTFVLPGKFISPALPSLFFFFIATSLLSFYYLLQSVGKRFIKFVNTFLLTIIIKLFLYVGVMIVYVLINRKDAVAFMLGFFVLYLFYSIFEAVCIIKNNQPAAPDSTIR